MADAQWPVEAFVFNLHLICGGYAYFSTITHGLKGMDKHGRDIRTPSPFILSHSAELLDSLGLQPFYIEDSSGYNHWLFRRGWAFVHQEFASEEMTNWLVDRRCLSDSLGSFTDMTIAAPFALNDHTSRSRSVVLKRDGCRCLACGKWSEFDRDITMGHVTARSHGGETTSRNLVPLCNLCNQKLGTQLVPRLYELANIPHFFDPAFVKDGVTADSLILSTQLTTNLMHTRCDLP